MRPSRGIPLVAALALALAVSGFLGGTQAKVLGLGYYAPDFDLVDLAGQHHRLSETRGSVVLLEFWATWCQPCLDAMPEIEKLKEQFGPRGVKFFAIHSKDGNDPVEAFRRGGATYPLLLDGTPVSQHYGVRGLPVFIIVDREGKIAFRATGFGEGAGAILALKIGDALGDKTDKPESPAVPEFDDVTPAPPAGGSRP